MITHHTQLLQALIDKYGLKSYLEIGVQNPANNFDKVKCEWKVGVDPEWVCNPNGGIKYVGTSDEYFNERPKESSLFELIFLDGKHYKEQIKKDFENSLRCLSDNGFIVIHDVLPENEAGTIVPRQTKQWWGDVYKFAMAISEYDNIGFKTLNIDQGCMLIWKEPGNIGRQGIKPMTWSLYLQYGRTLMNVTDEVNQFTI